MAFFKNRGPRVVVVEQLLVGSNLYVLRSDGTIEKQTGKDKGRYPIEGVSLDLEAGSDLHKRVTAGRVVALGLLAPLVKKTVGGERYLVIEGEGFAWLDEVPVKKVPAAMRFVQAVRHAQRGAGLS